MKCDSALAGLGFRCWDLAQNSGVKAGICIEPNFFGTRKSHRIWEISELLKTANFLKIKKSPLCGPVAPKSTHYLTIIN